MASGDPQDVRCPHCGHCKHCGAPNYYPLWPYGVAPIPTVPWYQPYPPFWVEPNPQVTRTITTTTSVPEVK